MIAELAERCAVQRLGELAGPSLSGAGWHAVRTGAASNDLNGVVSDGAIPDRDLALLLDWLAGVPASWHTTRADPALTDALVAARAVPERSGFWCGRDLTGLPAPLVAERADDPQRWSQVLEACGWYDDDLSVRHELRAAAFASEAWGHWWVVGDGAPVGVLAAWCGEALEVVDVAVLPAYRRRGIGTALVAAAVDWGREQGLSMVVAAPSPDGARLFATLGFDFEPVTPDVCFYLIT